MSQISRLKNAEIANGNLINADDISIEMNQLVAESNSQDTRVTTLESGAMTIAGVKQFSSAPKMDQIDERTGDAGVTIDGVLMKDGSIKTTPATQPYVPLANGEFGYDSTNHAYKVMVDGVARNLIHEGNTGLPKGFIGGPPPRYNNAASIIIPAGCRARNSTNIADIEAAGDLTVSLASSGANGLDTGAEANDTHYFVYLIRKSSDGTVAGLFSTVNEAAAGSVTLPGGYDQKRQLPYSVRNDGSGNIIPTVIVSGWPYRSKVLYRDYEESATYCVLNAGTATTFAAVSAAGLVPPISRSGDLQAEYNAPYNEVGTASVRATGSGLTTGRGIAKGYSDQYEMNAVPDVQTDANQSVDYKTSNATCAVTLYVRGYTITEVN